jgi:hypothetical protein
MKKQGNYGAAGYTFPLRCRDENAMKDKIFSIQIPFFPGMADEVNLTKVSLKRKTEEGRE